MEDHVDLILGEVEILSLHHMLEINYTFTVKTVQNMTFQRILVILQSFFKFCQWKDKQLWFCGTDTHPHWHPLLSSHHLLFAVWLQVILSSAGELLFSIHHCGKTFNRELELISSLGRNTFSISLAKCRREKHVTEGKICSTLFMHSNWRYFPAIWDKSFK